MWRIILIYIWAKYPFISLDISIDFFRYMHCWIRCIFIDSHVGYIANDEGYTLYVIITRARVFNRSLIRIEVTLETVQVADLRLAVTCSFFLC